MSELSDLQPDVVAGLRELGYEFDTYEETIDAVRAAYGVGALTASVLLTGRSDVVGPVQRATPSTWPTLTKRFDPGQRRDWHGRWSDGGGNPGFHGDLATAPWSELRDQFPTLARLEDEPDWLDSQKGKGDHLLESLAHDLGYDGPPRVVPNIPDEDGVTLYRGVFDGRRADQMRNGAYFGGHGTFGDGYYTTPDRHYAREFAKPGGFATSFGGSGFDSGHPGVITRLRLPPDTRVIDFEEASNARFPDMDALAQRDDLSAKQVALLQGLIEDVGHWAAFRGYQAVSLKGKHDGRWEQDDQVIVLDRTVLEVEDHDEDSD